MAKNDKSPMGDRKKREYPRCQYCHVRFASPEDLSIHARFCKVRLSEEQKIREKGTEE
jgi:hypothetical protein